MIEDNSNVSLGIVDCSLYTRHIALKDDYLKIKTNNLAYTPLEYNCLEILAKIFIIPARQNQFLQENVFNNAPVRQSAFAKNTNSAFTGLYTENPFWYQQFDLRQGRRLRGGQPIVDSDAADISWFSVTTMIWLSRRNPLKSKRHFRKPLCTGVWFDLNARCYWNLSLSWTSCRTTEAGDRLYFSFRARYWIDCMGRTNVFGCSWKVLVLLDRVSQKDTFSLQQIFNRIPVLKYWCRGSFHSDYVPTLDNETFAIIITQPSQMQGEHWIMLANSCQTLYFADSLSRKKYSFLKQQYEQMMPEPLQSHHSICGF